MTEIDLVIEINHARGKRLRVFYPLIWGIRKIRRIVHFHFRLFLGLDFPIGRPFFHPLVPHKRVGLDDADAHQLRPSGFVERPHPARTVDIIPVHDAPIVLI